MDKDGVENYSMRGPEGKIYIYMDGSHNMDTTNIGSNPSTTKERTCIYRRENYQPCRGDTGHE